MVSYRSLVSMCFYSYSAIVSAPTTPNTNAIKQTGVFRLLALLFIDVEVALAEELDPVTPDKVAVANVSVLPLITAELPPAARLIVVPPFTWPLTVDPPTVICCPGYRVWPDITNAPFGPAVMVELPT